ncbi:hypothetical protein MAR_032228, partial [Mya arenaria]
RFIPATHSANGTDSWVSQNYELTEKHTYTLHRLQEQYEEGSGEEILHEIHELYALEGGKMNSKNLGIYIKYLFPSAEVWVPNPFFVCESTDSHVSFALFGDSVNGNATIKKVKFDVNGKWQLYFGSTEVHLTDLGIEGTFEFQRNVVFNVCHIVKKLPSCKGKPIERCKTNIASKHGIIEFVDDMKKHIVRSKSCLKIMGPFAKTDSCRQCQYLYRDIQNSNNELAEQNIASTPNQQSCVLIEEDNKDMNAVLENILPEAPPEMIELLSNQKQNLSRDPSGRRWDKKQLASAYHCGAAVKKTISSFVKAKSWFSLPASVDQRAGFNQEVFQWMRTEAGRHKAPEGSFVGGVCIDEMSIQDDLCFVKSHGEIRLMGFVDMGPVAHDLHILAGGQERPLATHVIQFLYIGLNGFRFPFACFPVNQAKAGNLHFLFWESVKFLNMHAFQVNFVSMDGAQSNRDFMHMFFNETSPRLENFSTKNIWSPNHPDITFVMDYSHVIKRVRNNILKSSHKNPSTKLLCFSTTILWEHWTNAFKWDHDTNDFPLHRKLTNDHFFLTSESKMRNKLAEDVLDGEMLNLMVTFQGFLGDSGSELNSTIELLQATSVIVRVFRDRRPITETADDRLEDLASALKWFNDWEAHVQEKEGQTNAQKEKQLMSVQTREDLNSCIIGFTCLCENVLSRARVSIVPARVNSDVIENIFCQQRGIINGNNTNPNFYQYVKNVNSVLLGQNVISKNSNADHRGCEPLCFSSDRAVYPKKRKLGEVSSRRPLSELNR